MINAGAERGRILFAVQILALVDDAAAVNGWAVAADGEIAKHLIDVNGAHLDDFLEHGEERPRASGLWVWEGYVWSYMSGYYEPELEEGHDGTWRRPTAQEIWRFSRGEPPFATEAPTCRAPSRHVDPSSYR